jgi:hypothetical protein
LAPDETVIGVVARFVISAAAPPNCNKIRHRRINKLNARSWHSVICESDLVLSAGSLPRTLILDLINLLASEYEPARRRAATQINKNGRIVFYQLPFKAGPVGFNYFPSVLENEL